MLCLYVFVWMSLQVQRTVSLHTLSLSVSHTRAQIFTFFSQNYFSFLELFLLLLYLNRLGLINLFPCSQRFCSAVARKKRIISFLAPIS